MGDVPLYAIDNPRSSISNTATYTLSTVAIVAAAGPR